MPSADKESLLQKARGIPRKPGVYLFKDIKGDIIYIGKAAILRDRVSSYFHSGSSGSIKTDYMTTKIADIEFIVTENEAEALLLENNLVKKNQPKFNINLKDDKSYPYIKLTVNDTYPTAYITRERKNDGSLYYGPYVNAGAARYTLQLMRKHLMIRSCTLPLSRIKRPCLMFHIHRCLGPCREGTVDPITYNGIVSDVQLLLQGKNSQLVERITQKMKRAAAELRYEQAASYRDLVSLLKEMRQDQQMVAGAFYEEDIIGYHFGESSIIAQIFHIRRGLMLGRKEFVIRRMADSDPQEFLRSLICQYYFDELVIPPVLLTDVIPNDSENVRKIIAGIRNGPFDIIQPKKGRRRRLLDLAMENARLSYETMHSRSDEINALQELQRVLKLDILPEHIEAFDISTLQGQQSVASMVVFKQGRPDKSLYRKYKIKTVTGVDDYASMREVVERRYRRVLEESSDMPGLVLIDGGPGQLSAAREALDAVGVFDQPVAALAKKEELVYLPKGGEPLRLPNNSPALWLLQRVRDEAHRFAVTFQRASRKTRALKSSLEEIPGIGPVYRKKLLTKFGSVKKIQEATVDELAEIVGKKRAAMIKDYRLSGKKSEKKLKN